MLTLCVTLFILSAQHYIFQIICTDYQFPLFQQGDQWISIYFQRRLLRVILLIRKCCLQLWRPTIYIFFLFLIIFLLFFNIFILIFLIIHLVLYLFKKIITYVTLNYFSFNLIPNLSSSNPLYLFTLILIPDLGLNHVLYNFTL